MNTINRCTLGDHLTDYTWTRNCAFVCLALMLIILLIPVVSATAPDEGTFELDEQELEEAWQEYENAQMYDSPVEVSQIPGNYTNDFPKTSYAEWDQGNCGNCWVWAGTAAVAQSYKVFSGRSEPISVQFFNSNHFDGNIGQVKPHNWACTGGFAYSLAGAYDQGLNQSYPDEPFVVPWSNYNASYIDGTIDQNDQENKTTLLPKGLMSTTPNIRFNSMNAERLISTNPTNRTEAINNMTAVLAERKVIWYAVEWPDNANLTRFSNFWRYQPNDTYDPSVMGGLTWTNGSGHAMAITGYNKTDMDSANWYWIVQNSWGTSANRTTGQFKLKMDMDYNASYYDASPPSPGWGPIQQFWVINVDWWSATPPSPSSDSDTGTGASSRAAHSPGAPAGQTMTFAVNEPVNARTPGGIIAVGIVPARSIGSTELIVANAGTPDKSQFTGRQVAEIVSIEPVGVNPSAIDQGTIMFAVAGKWLTEKGLKTSDIVLMRNHGGWSELATSFDHQSGDMFYFTAITPGFSNFAITTRLNTTAGNATAQNTVTIPATVPVTAATTVSVAGMPVQPKDVTTPATTRTTAIPPAGTSPEGSGGLPFITVIAGIAGIIILVALGFVIRRWWIRRQNPALFRKYD